MNRTSDRDSAADDSYLHRIWSGRGRFDWERLQQRPLVVVLGEQGSGKSWEIEHRAAQLAANGHYAFYLRLEELVTQPLSAVLGAAAAAVFDGWKAGAERSTFFLDSVDESKLSGAEAFHTALRRFREALPDDFAARACIVLSSRVSEWHPETDGARVREYFGLPERQQKRETEDEEETTPTKRGEDGLLVVQLNALDREQVATLARAKGYPRVDDFLAALDRAHAWEFARRPIDVSALAEFWQQHGRIGTLTELIEFDLVRNLRERRAHVRDPLTEAEARQGAETLAAGIVFCGEGNIKVSDANQNGAGLDGQACLPGDFTRDKFDSLLSRAVFDGASFGRVRFHHRRVREYLAACWVNRRMADGCSLEELDGIFFDHLRGQRVLRASRAAVAAWLCAAGDPWNVAMRRWVLEAAPDLNLRYGDPHALPLDYKQAVLAKLVDAARTRGHLWIETDTDALSRLADPALAPQLDAIIRNRQLASDLRSAMLEVVRHGRLAACLPAVLDLIADQTEADELKVYAVAALRELEDGPSLVRLAQIASALPRVTPALTDLLVDALFPERLSVSEFVALLRKTRDRAGRDLDLHWQIRGSLAEKLQPAEAGPLLEHLVELVSSEPHFPVEQGEPVISQEHAWLRPLITVALTALLRKPVLSASEVTSAAAALAFVGQLRERDLETGEDKIDLQKLTLAHPNVRREFCWAAVRRRRPLGMHMINHPMDVFSRHDGFLQPAAADVEWLVSDLATLPDELDREVALLQAMRWYLDTGRPWGLRWRIRRAIAGNARFLEIYRAMVREGRVRPFRQYYHRLEHLFYRRRNEGRRAWGWIMKRVNRLRSRFYLKRNLAKLSRGELPGPLNYLLHKADRNSGRLTVSGWMNLESKWGSAVTTAVRAGCKAYWRTYRPDLPHECADSSLIPNALVVGLSGIQAAWKDGELDFATLPDDDVKLATRYALREINGFPSWLAPLAQRRPGPVGEVFAACVLAEWNVPADRQRPYDGLQRLAWGAAPLLPAVQATAMSALQAGDPSGRALGLLLGHLLNSATPPLAELQALACARVAAPATPAGAIAIWFAVWLQIDPDAAIAAWQTHVAARPDADSAMVIAASALQDRDLGSGPRVANPRHLTVPVLRQLVPLVFGHVKPAEDIDRTQGGGYSPTARDHAQEFRGALLRDLTDSQHPAAAETLLEFANLPVFAIYRDRLLHLRDENLKQLADRERWQAADVRQFTADQEAEPRTDRDLYRIVLKRLGDMKHDVERSDLGLRTQLRAGDREFRLRIWAAQELIRRSRHRYTVPQEAVIDLNQRPDIRLENPRTDAVSVEIKWAQDWSFNDLLTALEVQLLGQYLRAHHSRHGILLIGMHDGGRQGWDPPAGGRLRFPELIAALQTKAVDLERAHPEAKRLSVVGIDYRAPGP